MAAKKKPAPKPTAKRGAKGDAASERILAQRDERFNTGRSPDVEIDPKGRALDPVSGRAMQKGKPVPNVPYNPVREETKAELSMIAPLDWRINDPVAMVRDSPYRKIVANAATRAGTAAGSRTVSPLGAKGRPRPGTARPLGSGAQPAAAGAQGDGVRLKKAAAKKKR